MEETEARPSGSSGTRTSGRVVAEWEQWWEQRAVADERRSEGCEQAADGGSLSARERPRPRG